MLSTLLGQVVKPEACTAAELGFEIGFVAEDLGTGEVKVMIVDPETGLVTHEEVICQAEDLDVVQDATVMIQLAGRPETATTLHPGGADADAK